MGVDRKPGNERHADTRRHHVYQRVQAAGLELRPRPRVAHLAGVERVTAQAVPLLQKQEAFAGERFERHFAGAGERVRPVAGEQELVLEDDVGDEVPGVAGQSNQGCVQLSVFQPGEQRDRLLLSQVERQRREHLPQRRQDARQVERTDRRDHAEVHLPGHRRTVGPGQLHDLFGVPQQCLRSLRDLIADARHQHVPVRALRDRGSEHGLQVADAHAERRLGDVATLGCTAEVPRLGQRHQVLELLCRGQTLHRASPETRIRNVRLQYPIIVTLHESRQLLRSSVQSCRLSWNGAFFSDGSADRYRYGRCEGQRGCAVTRSGRPASRGAAVRTAAVHGMHWPSMATAIPLPPREAPRKARAGRPRPAGLRDRCNPLNMLRRQS